MMWKAIKFFLVLSLLTPVGPVQADVAPDPLYKGMTPARRESLVQMVSQDVVIRLGSDWCRVEADFLLHNRSLRPAAMEVGFPTGYEDEVKELLVRRNGITVKTRNAAEREILDPDKDPATYHWTLWDMRFAPDEKSSLKVTYRVKPRKNHDYIITPYRQFLDRIEKEAGTKRPVEVQRVIDGMISYSTGYIMVTGAGWHDVIEKASVTLRHPRGAGAIRWLDPPGHFFSTPEGIQWRFEYIKPDFDVSVEFSDIWTLEEEMGLVKQAIAVSDKNQGLNNHIHYLELIKKGLAAGAGDSGSNTRNAEPP
jgi:hypothetical protein